MNYVGKKKEKLMKIGKVSVDYTALISRADITYFSPTTWSEEGLPIGNGCMGTLLWTINNSLAKKLGCTILSACPRRLYGNL